MFVYCENSPVMGIDHGANYLSSIIWNIVIQIFLEPVFDAVAKEEEWKEDWNFIMKWNKNERRSNL